MKIKKRKIFIKIIILVILFIIAIYLSFKYMTKDVNAISSKKIRYNGQYYNSILMNTDDIYVGELILVNESTKYTFKNDDVKSIIKEYNKAYTVKDKNVYLKLNSITALNDMFKSFKKNTGLSDILIIDGYRTYEEQKKILNSRIKEQGEERARSFVANPGFSEHHSGYAIDIGIFRNGNVFDFTGEDKYSWIIDNMHKYGWIIRYETHKSSITKIDYEPWHLRYVGKPHAYIMKKNDLCLEEYIDYIKEYEFSKKHLIIKDDENNEYEIYYFKASENKTVLPIPNGKYTVSGNNIDGFIVTLYK